MDNTKYASSLNELKATHETTLKTISELQAIEKQLYTQLETASASLGANGISEQQKIIDRINSLSDTRVGLFNTLNTLSQSTQNNVYNTRNALVDKLVASKVVENELNNLKNNFNEMTETKNNRLRMVEINNYYTKRHQAHSAIMKLIILICAIALLLTILNKKGFIPSNIYKILVVLTLAGGSYFIIMRLVDANMRSNMDYDKYEWAKMPSKEYGEYTGPDLDQPEIDASLWSVCGEGTKFHTGKKQCLEASLVTENDTLGGLSSGIMSSTSSGLTALTGKSIESFTQMENKKVVPANTEDFSSYEKV